MDLYTLAQGLLWMLRAASLALLAMAALKLVYVPLSLWFEARPRLTRAGRARMARGPRAALRRVHRTRKAHGGSRRRLRYRHGTLVSVIVPAYNEAVVLRPCVESILASRYPNLEVILVNDGSTDGTGALMRELAREHPAVTAVDQANAGKGAALNTGIARARGEILLFVDADGIFTPRTVEWLLVGFADASVGAVCGDDRPANPDRTLTKMLSVLSHLGTGMVRRTLSILHCLPIVSGNIGAFRADLVRAVGGFDEHTLGEDLELTWRVYGAGYRVAFQPRAIVYAESPSTVRGLWRQRVRWARGLLQTTWKHRRMVGNPTLGVFGVFLVFNTFTMILVPVLQLAILAGVFALIPAGMLLFGGTVMAVLGWIGLFYSCGLALLAIALNGAWRDLRYLWTIVLWPAYSTLMGAVMLVAVARELRGAPATWNKLQRTGVVTRGVSDELAGQTA